MALQTKHYVGAIGTVIYVDTQTDLTTATTLQLLVKKPSGEELWWDCVLGPADAYGNYTIMKYVTATGDWDEAGWWSIQAYIVTPAFRGRGATAKFQLFSSFN